MSLKIGEKVHIGHNGAKMLGDEFAAYSEVRVEAVGFDWVVVRTRASEPRAATFTQGADFRKELGS